MRVTSETHTLPSVSLFYLKIYISEYDKMHDEVLQQACLPSFLLCWYSTLSTAKQAFTGVLPMQKCYFSS